MENTRIVVKVLRVKAMRRKIKLSPTKEVPDKETSSPCQYCRKCKENIVENININFSM